MRLALAQALYSEPDILLLDEPTNHIDISARLFLESFLVKKNMTVVVLSHGGHFLNAICTDMIKFGDCKRTYHVGNYSSFQEHGDQTRARNCSKVDAAVQWEKKAKKFTQKQRNMANSKRRDNNKLKQAAERQKKLGRIQFLGRFGLVGSLALQKTGTLCGGQKARLAFATVMSAEPFVLILDEPSNHLDSYSQESLAAAMENFQGAG